MRCSWSVAQPSTAGSSSSARSAAWGKGGRQMAEHAVREAGGKNRPRWLATAATAGQVGQPPLSTTTLLCHALVQAQLSVADPT